MSEVKNLVMILNIFLLVTEIINNHICVYRGEFSQKTIFLISDFGKMSNRQSSAIKGESV